MTKKLTVKKVISQMEELGVYKPQFLTSIEVYVGLVNEYRKLEQKIKEEGDEFKVESEGKKRPLISVREKLRADILSYSNALMLNPKSHKNDEVKKEQTIPNLFEGVPVPPTGK